MGWRSVEGLPRVRVRGALKGYLQLAGKDERRVAAVFGGSRDDCEQAVRYLRQGAPGTPIWLFSPEEPSAETAALCERVIVDRNTIRLLATAERRLWPLWLTLGVATWTNGPGKWPLKLAPFLIPPFRALLMNEHLDFFPGTFRAILLHLWHRLRDSAHSSWHRAGDLTRYRLALVAGKLRRGIRDPLHSGWHRAQDLGRGVGFLLLAKLMQSFPAWTELAFQRLHGATPMDVPCRPASSVGVIRFEYQHPRVSWQELARLARSSTCRLILLQEKGSQDAVDDMLPLFEDERTFAASRQAGFREWRLGVFARAPFRALQPGEACRVLAPVSPTILVDREKLLALGLVETSYAGTAWLILFWKAAAAGFHSYSVGGTTALTRLSDWPVQDAEFAVQFLSNRALAALGPREPDLRRGSISFRIGAARRPKKRPLVLVVSPYLPYPLSHGGAVRIYNLCRALSGNVDFMLAAFREKDDTTDYAKLHEIFCEVHVVDKEDHSSHDSRLPSRVREYQSRSMSALIAELCRERSADLLQIEYTHMAAFREAAPQVPAILVEHDLTFALYRQLARLSATRADWQEYQRWLAFERRWLSAFNAVWTVSEEDRAVAIRQGSRPETTFVVPNGVDTGRYKLQKDEATELEILYVGSFRHLPNILGFEKLRQEVMPHVWKRWGDAQLRVVAGPQPEQYWREITKCEFPASLDPRIRVHGFVEDLRPLYQKARAVVVPLLVSAGTNIKLLEALACGKPVVTTPVGCSGLGLADGEDVLIRAEWEQFAEALIEVLGNAEVRDRIGSCALRTAQQRFSWMAIAEGAYASYLSMTEMPEIATSAQPAEGISGGAGDPDAVWQAYVRGTEPA